MMSLRGGKKNKRSKFVLYCRMETCDSSFHQDREKEIVGTFQYVTFLCDFSVNMYWHQSYNYTTPQNHSGKEKRMETAKKKREDLSVAIEKKNARGS